MSDQDITISRIDVICLSNPLISPSPIIRALKRKLSATFEVEFEKPVTEQCLITVNLYFQIDIEEYSETLNLNLFPEKSDEEAIE